MKNTIKKGLFIAIIGFLILFLVKLVHSYVSNPSGQTNTSTTYYPTSTFEVGRKNYASKKMVRTQSNKTPVPTVQVDQKYEKVASMTAQSAGFTEDEQKIRSLIKTQNALIQFEQRSGLAKRRRLNLAIGVDPNKFESFNEALSKIGKLTAIQIDKLDKTNEYKTLNAKKASLEKTRESLIALKTQGGKVDELINLENRILEIEEQIQGFGLKLGEFDKENEFCTVKYTLIENSALVSNLSFFDRAIEAFAWAAMYGALVAFLLCCAAIFSACVVFILDKLKPYFQKYW